MKIHWEHRDADEVEVIIRGRKNSGELLRILTLLETERKRLCVWDEDHSTVLLSPGDVVWCEVVDEKVFVYTARAMYQTALGLAELESRWESAGFFRCAKSAVVNLNCIQRLCSRPGSRIEATLDTGERLMVSRRYAPMLRERLRQEKEE